jgi:Kef-type K+ transport system membrane component KefB
MLVPILQKFKLMKTQLGKSIVGIGVLNNTFEYLVLMATMIFRIRIEGGFGNIVISVVEVLILAIIIKLMKKSKRISNTIGNASINFLFLLSVGILFAFVSMMET